MVTGSQEGNETNRGPLRCPRCDVKLDYIGTERYTCPQCRCVISFRKGRSLFLLVLDDIYGCVGRIVVFLFFLWVLFSLWRILKPLDPTYFTNYKKCDIVIFGKVLDTKTGEEISSAEVAIETDKDGTLRFGSLFAFGTGDNDHIDFVASAPGYESHSEPFYWPIGRYVPEKDRCKSMIEMHNISLNPISAPN